MKTSLFALLLALATAAPAFGQSGRLRVRPVIDPRSPVVTPPAFPAPAPLRTVPAPPPIPIGPCTAPLPRSGGFVPEPDIPDAIPRSTDPGAFPPRADRPATAPAPPGLTTVVKPGGPRSPRSVRALSFTHIALPEPRAIAVHDIVTVLVDEKSEVAVQSRFDRRKNASIDAELNEFVRLDDFGRLVLSATGDPGLDATSGVRMQASGNSLDAEAVRYRIAAEVVDVLPNGNLVLEARKQIQNNRDVWEYTLTGTIAAEKVNRDMTALSEDVAAMKIRKRSTGKIFSSTHPGWAVRILDCVWPF